MSTRATIASVYIKKPKHLFQETMDWSIWLQSGYNDYHDQMIMLFDEEEWKEVYRQIAQTFLQEIAVKSYRKDFLPKSIWGDSFYTVNKEKLIENFIEMLSYIEEKGKS